MSQSKAITAVDGSIAAKSAAAADKRKWWQRLFLYPTVIGALMGAIPTGLDYYKAFVYDIEFSAVKHAEEQRRLWVKNFACAMNITYQQVRTAENILVQVGACANGDVLIEVAPPNGSRIVEWISLDRLKTASAVSSLSLIGKAYARSAPRPSLKKPADGRIQLAQANISIKCQKMQGQTKIIRIVQQGGACYREEIDVMKGKVIARRPVPCTASCG